MLTITLCAALVAGVIRLNLWHRKFQKQDKIRRQRLTPEEREKEADADGWDIQW